MDLIAAFSSLLAPAFTLINLAQLLAIRGLMNKSKRLEEDLRETNLRILRLTGIIVKYCSAPIEVVLDELKDQKNYLTEIPQDDILGQVLDKYIRS